MNEFITRPNESIVKHVHSGRIPSAGSYSLPIAESPWQHDFMARLRSATDDTSWHLRNVNDGGLALCQWVAAEPMRFYVNDKLYTALERKFAPWYIGRSGAFDSTLIYYAQMNHYRNIKRFMRELEENEAARATEKKRQWHDKTADIGDDLYAKAVGRKYYTGH
jgi:hypothetical protein